MFDKCGAAVTVEDHNIIGGLGSAIAEAAVVHCPTPTEFVGLKDIFPSSGPADELLDYYGMSEEDIIYAVKSVIKRKSKSTLIY